MSSGLRCHHSKQSKGEMHLNIKLHSRKHGGNAPVLPPNFSKNSFMSQYSVPHARLVQLAVQEEIHNFQQLKVLVHYSNFHGSLQCYHRYFMSSLASLSLSSITQEKISMMTKSMFFCWSLVFWNEVHCGLTTRMHLSAIFFLHVHTINMHPVGNNLELGILLKMTLKGTCNHVQKDVF